MHTSRRTVVSQCLLRFFFRANSARHFTSLQQISDVFRGVMTPPLMPTGPDDWQLLDTSSMSVVTVVVNSYGSLPSWMAFPLIDQREILGRPTWQLQVADLTWSVRCGPFVAKSALSLWVGQNGSALSSSLQCHGRKNTVVDTLANSHVARTSPHRPMFVGYRCFWRRWRAEFCWSDAHVLSP